MCDKDSLYYNKDETHLYYKDVHYYITYLACGTHSL